MITVANLTKRYGSHTAVDDLSFTVQPGIVTGFLGPNGAGKSTTMRLILGLDRPTSGSALVNGRPMVDQHGPISEIGALLRSQSRRTEAVGEKSPARTRRIERDFPEAGR